MGTDKFSIDDLVDFVINEWESAYLVSFFDAMDVVRSFAHSKGVEVDYDEVKQRWAEKNRILELDV